MGHINAQMKEVSNQLFLRQISSSEWQTRSSKGSASSDAVSLSHHARTLDLPFYTKFLLLAAFLASFNPPRLDVRFFSKGKEDRIKHRKNPHQNETKVFCRALICNESICNVKQKTRQQLLGPRAFPLERMLGIFYSILPDPIQESTSVSQQVFISLNRPWFGFNSSTHIFVNILRSRLSSHWVS